MMRERLRPLGVMWYEEAGTVHVSKYRRTADDRLVTISEKTGMVGSPAVTDDGIRVQTLLDPRLRLDTQFRVESSVLDRAASGDAVNERAAELDGGTWKITELEHRGDNREGDYLTVITGTPLNEVTIIGGAF